MHRSRMLACAPDLQFDRWRPAQVGLKERDKLAEAGSCLREVQFGSKCLLHCTANETDSRVELPVWPLWLSPDHGGPCRRRASG
jgi:hypothetical protein